MKLTNEQIKSITFGAIRVCEENGILHFHKCTQKQIDVWTSHKEILGERAATSSGIRLDFHTDSQNFAFRSFQGNKFEIYVDGLLRKQVFFKAEDTEKEIKIPLRHPLGNKQDSYRVTVYFPSHEDGVIEWVELDDSATVTPHEYDRKWLFIGDSITQGWAAIIDSLSYALRVSRFFNADCVVQGIGGAYFAEDSFDHVDFDPEIVSVAYGTNDFGHYQTLDELREHARAHLALIAEEYKGKKLFYISPLWRGKRDKPMGTFEECREVLITEAEALGFTHIDGLSLVPPLPNFFYDEYLHPDNNGFSLYAENLISAIKDKI